MSILYLFKFLDLALKKHWIWIWRVAEIFNRHVECDQLVELTLKMTANDYIFSITCMTHEVNNEQNFKKLSSHRGRMKKNYHHQRKKKIYIYNYIYILNCSILRVWINIFQMILFNLNPYLYILVFFFRGTILATSFPPSLYNSKFSSSSTSCIIHVILNCNHLMPFLESTRRADHIPHAYFIIWARLHVQI